jgi:hypothetical protein
VLFCCDGNGGAIQVFVTTLNFKHLLHHIRCCTTWMSNGNKVCTSMSSTRMP